MMITQARLADSDEQSELRDMVRRLLRETAPVSALRHEPAFDRELWKKISSELGLVGVAVPEKYDGLGQTALEVGVIFEEMGRALYGGPYLACVGLAIPTLLHAGDDEACTSLLPQIVGGESVATVAIAEANGSWDVSSTATEATRSDDGWRLSGEKSFVLAGADADLLLVTARHGMDVSVFAVRADAPGVTTTRLQALDFARPVAALSLNGSPATLVGTAGAAPEIVEAVLDDALVFLAAEQSGGAQACLEMSVDYVKTREQFGRVIGSFQAVAHTCVDMLQRVEFSRSAARYALAASVEQDRDFSVAARVAAAYCGKAFREVAVETVHLHGGIGFTWEHDAHLYYRRAFSSEHLFGCTDDHYLAVADRIGL
jgi:alkylation response protein AidB-like acyl-CoA dehydrogenase